MQREAFSEALKKVKLEGFVWPDPDDANDLRLIKNVIECGCHIIAVEKEIGRAEFAYSIGLYLNYLQPEVIIVEMDRAAAGKAINKIAAHLKKGRALTRGVPYDGFHHSAPLMFRELRV